MKRNINADIRDQYEFFSELLYNEKKIRQKTIPLEEKKNNAYWLTGSTNVLHNNIEEDIKLTVEKRKQELKYAIKLRCTTLSEVPFFRFDSDGPAHRNDDPNIPLAQQIITTPHFNSFNKEGVSIAYKTEVLKEGGQTLTAILADINNGVAHFCDESKIVPEEVYPEILDTTSQLGFGESGVDLFHGLNFE